MWCEVYTLGSGQSWRITTTQVPYEPVLGHKPVEYRGGGDGGGGGDGEILVWKTSTIIDDRSCRTAGFETLLMFNVETETFGTMRGPQISPGLLCLGEIHDRISLNFAYGNLKIMGGSHLMNMGNGTIGYIEGHSYWRDLKIWVLKENYEWNEYEFQFQPNLSNNQRRVLLSGDRSSISGTTSSDFIGLRWILRELFSVVSYWNSTYLGKEVMSFEDDHQVLINNGRKLVESSSKYLAELGFNGLRYNVWDEREILMIKFNCVPHAASLVSPSRIMGTL